ncbi:MAG: potassium channel family protein, partial [Actinomycetota bacterium]
FKIVRSQMKWPGVLALSMTIVSVLGYLVVTDLSVFDSIYLTWITMGTIGFGEVGELGTDGRIWTMCVILGGYVVLAFVTAKLAALLMSGSFSELRSEKRRSKLQRHLDHHLIIIGFGKVGRSTAEVGLSSGQQVAVIDVEPHISDEIESIGAIPVAGDARDLDTLERAGIQRAAAVICALSDPDNLVVISTARLINKEVRIIARVLDSEWTSRLTAAGATELVPVYRSAGEHLAHAARADGVQGAILGRDEMIVEEIVVSKNSRVLGKTPRDVMKLHPGLVVVGIRRDSKLLQWHENVGPFLIGDVMVLVGRAEATRAV